MSDRRVDVLIAGMMLGAVSTAIWAWLTITPCPDQLCEAQCAPLNWARNGDVCLCGVADE